MLKSVPDRHFFDKSLNHPPTLKQDDESFSRKISWKKEILAQLANLADASQEY